MWMLVIGVLDKIIFDLRKQNSAKNSLFVTQDLDGL